MTPQIFAEKAMELASDRLKVTVIEDMSVLEKDYPLVYAVGKGSTNPPKLLKLEYKGAPDTDQHVALVGKGVTFDSGGTNLKPSGSIEDMKCDMSGGATVLGVTKNRSRHIYGYQYHYIYSACGEYHRLMCL